MQRLHSADPWLFGITARPTRNLCVRGILRWFIWLCFQLPIRTSFSQLWNLENADVQIPSGPGYDGCLYDWDLKRLVTIFTAPSQQWNYDHSGPEIRSGRTHCGREWLHSLFKSRPVSIPVWCIAWLKILSSAITHICSLCQINRQLIRKRNNSKWASASWTTVSLS